MNSIQWLENSFTWDVKEDFPFDEILNKLRLKLKRIANKLKDISPDDNVVALTNAINSSLFELYETHTESNEKLASYYAKLVKSAWYQTLVAVQEWLDAHDVSFDFQMEEASVSDDDSDEQGSESDEEDKEEEEEQMNLSYYFEVADLRQIPTLSEEEWHDYVRDQSHLSQVWFDATTSDVYFSRPSSAHQDDEQERVQVLEFAGPIAQCSAASLRQVFALLVLVAGVLPQL